MQYENRQPDETVNYNREHPLKEFAWLVFGLLGVVVIAAAVLGFFGGKIAARVPFSVEKDYAKGILEHWENKSRDTQTEAARAALREIAARLAPVMQLPPGMEIHVHYSPDGIANAFATLGGNVVFYRGLLEKFDSEDAVALVMAHEIAHAKLRHPASSLGRGIAVGLTLSVVSAGVGEGVAGGAVQTAGVLPLLKYSRNQESDADTEALAALAAVYGHVGGARDAFAVMAKLGSGELPRGPQVNILRTHPLTADRIAAVDRVAAARGWKADGERTPLPPALANLRTKAQEAQEKPAAGR